TTFSFSATASSFAALREAMITSAPSCFAISAVASPIPEEPPTTTTFLPFNTMLSPNSFLPNRSRRLVARAAAGLALAEPRQFPDTRADRIDVGGDIDVDQVRLVSRDALADRFRNVAGAIDPHALDAAGARHRSEIRIVALAR